MAVSVRFDHPNTRWFKYDRDYLCVNKSQFVPVIFEPPCNTINWSVIKSEYILAEMHKKEGINNVYDFGDYGQDRPLSS
jgi:hypothetical protein